MAVRSDTVCYPTQAITTIYFQKVFTWKAGKVTQTKGLGKFIKVAHNLQKMQLLQLLPSALTNSQYALQATDLSTHNQTTEDGKAFPKFHVIIQLFRKLLKGF